MYSLSALQHRYERGDISKLAVIGAGYVGTGVVHTAASIPSIVPSIVVNRTISKAVSAFVQLGYAEKDVIISDSPDVLSRAIHNGNPAVCEDYSIVLELPIDIIVEATGAINFGAEVILDSLNAGKHVVSFNAEVDSLLAYEFHRCAKRNNVIYTIADGDQPGAQLRLKQQVEFMGFDVTVLVNCKRHLNIHQNPDSGSSYSARDATSAHMTTSFGDGTKMQIEQSVVANICSMKPAKRGMFGVESTVENAAVDFSRILPDGRFVDFTLGGDFSAGVGVMCTHENYHLHRKAMQFYKMGEGPKYFFFRPYHLVHLELASTMHTVLVESEALGYVDNAHTTEVVAISKKQLKQGEKLDCIGGFSAYGHISSTEEDGLLPMCLIEFATMKVDLAKDRPILLSDVETRQICLGCKFVVKVTKTMV